MKWLVSHNSLQLWTVDRGRLAFHSLHGVPSLLPTNRSSSVSFSDLFSDCLHNAGGPYGPVFSHPTSTQTSGCPTLHTPCTESSFVSILDLLLTSRHMIAALKTIRHTAVSPDLEMVAVACGCLYRHIHPSYGSSPGCWSHISCLSPHTPQLVQCQS